MSKKLLLADDSITIQKVIQITFAHEDYELTITGNGDSALAKALEIKPDLVMADVYMPGKNGYELTSAIKQHPALQQVPVLLLAGSFEPFDEDKARSCKADAWIEKPFESQTLIDKVAELLSAAQKASEAQAPVAEPVAVVDVELTAVAGAAIEETPRAAFEAPQEAFQGSTSAEPEMTAVPEDPFGDICFEEEPPVTEETPVAVADDWSDFVIEPLVAEPVPSVAEPAIEDMFTVAEEPAAATIEPTANDFAAIEDVPVAETDFDVFEMGDDEIMSLGDDDILGEEDLEPAMHEQTLATWFRDEKSGEDILAEPLEAAPAFEAEPAYVPATGSSVEATPGLVADEPVAEVTSVFEKPVTEVTPVSEAPVAEPVSAEEPSAVVEEPEPAAVAAAVVDVEAVVDVKAKASALSDGDIEKILEKVVTKVVEKLAESILERVAWEVVPDLAENLIREEIRKIKDAAA